MSLACSANPINSLVLEVHNKTSEWVKGPRLLMPSTLQQHSLAALQRYEHHIYQIVENYPKETIFDPTPYSSETFIARIRDAIKGMKLNSHASTLFTTAQCESVFSHLKCGGDFIFTKHTGNLIRCGARQRVEARGAVDSSNTVVSVSDGELDARNEKVFDAVFLLKEMDIITDQVTFANLSTSQLERVQSSFNLELVETDKPYKHILI